MGCCTPFTPNSPMAIKDPHAHVNYNVGMVLGVDDYAQEFAYHSNRDKWIVRDLLGYGTASGLHVYTEDHSDGPRIHVTAGSAAAPSGQMICVSTDQCASINAWLKDEKNREKIAGNTLTAYLTLCYKDCATSMVPIPGEPCRSDDELMQPSRIIDDYCLHLTIEPPTHLEWHVSRNFAAWLRKVRNGDFAPPDDGSTTSARNKNPKLLWPETISKSLDFIVKFAQGELSEAEALAASKKLSIGVPAEDFSDFLDMAQRIWVTEYRPKVQALSCSQSYDPKLDCVFLAEIKLTITNGNVVTDKGGVEIIETDRPILNAMAQLNALLNISKPPDPAPTSSLLRVKILDDTAPDKIEIDINFDIFIATKNTGFTLPASQENEGRHFSLRPSKDGISIQITPQAGDMLEGAVDFAQKITHAVTLVSAGSAGWWQIAHSHPVEQP
jgi:hypothetical protein